LQKQKDKLKDTKTSDKYYNVNELSKIIWKLYLLYSIKDDNIHSESKKTMPLNVRS